ncbi:hypothetical protein F0225_10735 [Vibrio pectenicida]|uniref:Uncharacterized protein n=1 Tax=Vibrio pectenicida TaxID=62763 RepID=A0A7Y4EEX0_9VIBR|nr:hypothetical protein [Vibrio pectenicida]
MNFPSFIHYLSCGRFIYRGSFLITKTAPFPIRMLKKWLNNTKKLVYIYTIVKKYDVFIFLSPDVSGLVDCNFCFIINVL